MKLTIRQQQLEKVDELKTTVQYQSAKAVRARRAITDRKKAVVGRPAVMVWCFAGGAWLASRRGKKEATSLSVVKSSSISTMSLMNTGLAVWALLKRVDLLNQSNVLDSQSVDTSKSDMTTSEATRS